MPTDDTNPWDDAAEEPSFVPAATPSGTPHPHQVGDTEAHPLQTSTDAPTSDDPPPAGSADPDDDAEDRRRVIVIAGVVFLLIAVVAFALIRGNDDDETAGSGNGDSTTTAAGGGGNETLAIAGTTDTFNRADDTSGLGNLPSGAAWEVISGGWGIQTNEAVVATPVEAPRRNVAIVRTGYTDAQAQVRMTKVAVNAGLVFRFSNNCNYWTVTAVPEYAVWNVSRIRCDGPSEVVQVAEQAPVADGTTVGVVLTGERVRVVVNGRVVLDFSDADLAGKGGVGMVTAGADPVRFDDFTAGGPNGQGVVGPSSTQPGGDDSTTTAPEGGGEGGSTTTAAPSTEGGGG